MVVIANDDLNPETELRDMYQNGQVNGQDKDSESNSATNADGKSPLRRSAFRAMVQDFGPIWFTL